MIADVDDPRLLGLPAPLQSVEHAAHLLVEEGAEAVVGRVADPLLLPRRSARPRRNASATAARPGGGRPDRRCCGRADRCPPGGRGRSIPAGRSGGSAGRARRHRGVHGSLSAPASRASQSARRRRHGAVAPDQPRLADARFERPVGGCQGVSPPGRGRGRGDRLSRRAASRGAGRRSHRDSRRRENRACRSSSPAAPPPPTARPRKGAFPHRGWHYPRLRSRSHSARWRMTRARGRRGGCCSRRRSGGPPRAARASRCGRPHQRMPGAAQHPPVVLVGHQQEGVQRLDWLDQFHRTFLIATNGYPARPRGRAPPRRGVRRGGGETSGGYTDPAPPATA